MAMTMQTFLLRMLPTNLTLSTLSFDSTTTISIIPDVNLDLSSPPSFFPFGSEERHEESLFQSYGGSSEKLLEPPKRLIH